MVLIRLIESGLILGRLVEGAGAVSSAGIALVHESVPVNSIESVKWLDLILRLGFASQLYLPIACPSVPPYITADGHGYGLSWHPYSHICIRQLGALVLAFME